MSQKPDYDRGFRDGIRAAVTFLHNKGEEMNDSHAKIVLDVAAFHLGNRFSEKMSKLRRLYSAEIHALKNGAKLQNDKV